MDAIPSAVNPITRAVILEFGQRFAPQGEIAWVAESASAVNFVHTSHRMRHALAAIQSRDFPTVAIDESGSGRLILVDVAAVRGAMGESRRTLLARTLGHTARELIYVNAFRRRSDLATLARAPWGTVAWFADEPDHFIVFDGRSVRAPR